MNRGKGDLDLAVAAQVLGIVILPSEDGRETGLCLDRLGILGGNQSSSRLPQVREDNMHTSAQPSAASTIYRPAQ
jgi:hypothetical protein